MSGRIELTTAIDTALNGITGSQKILRPAIWTFNDNLYPESGGDPATNPSSTDHIYFSDGATVGGEGWQNVFLNSAGPWMLYVSGAGGIMAFRVTSMTDEGGGWSGLAVSQIAGNNESWTGDYSMLLISGGSQIALRDVEGDGVLTPEDSWRNRMVRVFSNVPATLTVPKAATTVMPLLIPIVVSNEYTAPITITPEDGDVTIYGDSPVRTLSVRYSQAVLVQESTNVWRLCGMPRGEFDKGQVSGAVDLNIADGLCQRCWISEATTFSFVGGNEGDFFELVIWFATSTYALDFSGIQNQTENPITLPKTLEVWKSYLCQFRKTGGQWTLLSITGGFTESVD